MAFGGVAALDAQVGLLAQMLRHFADDGEQHEGEEESDMAKHARVRRAMCARTIDSSG